ncbi:MAG: D-cysteine desulfhydrase family protein [Betaproteobacteria bacterium]|nr:D-cysteine desulfhydrase family protein [Betaproteobacteria bacterium]
MTLRTAASEVLKAVPRLPLLAGPTPLHRAPRLAGELDLAELWLKRDDLISFGFGGNKVRGLELIMADALKHGADTLVTGAGPLSNHVRACATAAARHGMSCNVVYWGSPPPGPRQGNLRLVELLGATVRFTGSADRESVDAMIEAEANRVGANGGRPYVIPRGGACPHGVLGHVAAVREFLAQASALGCRPDVVLLAVGSGGTLAGWLLGSRLFNAPWRVEGVTVSRPQAEAAEQVTRLAAAAAERFGIDATVGERDVIIHDGFIGGGYGIPTPEGNAAIALMARREGVFLDPTYTGKAFAALMHLAREGRFRRDRAVAFVHTGGAPTLFVDPEAAR